MMDRTRIVARRARGRRAVRGIVLAALAGLFAASCSSSDDNPTGASSPSLAVPTADQLSLDLPPSLAPPVTSGAQLAVRADGPPCVGAQSIGGTFACVTRFLLSQMAVRIVDKTHEMIAEVMQNLSAEAVPPGQVVSVVEDGMRIEVHWEEGDGFNDYWLDFFSLASGNQVGAWQWRLAADQSATGQIKIVQEMMTDSTDTEGTPPEGIFLTFASNADGSEKSIHLDIDMDDTPPPQDASAPIALTLEAAKSAGVWTVRYGMYHPAWLSDDPQITGVPTIILVSAVGGAANDSPAVMKIVGLSGDAVSVPADAETQNGLCDYIESVFVDAGLAAQGDFLCPPPNPFYVYGDGSVQEGGAAPAGFEALVAALATVDFVVADPSTIRNLAIHF